MDENYVPQFFSEQEFKFIKNLIDVIIPESDSPLSIKASVHQMLVMPNVFVTDGAFMTSYETQNPSITYMALTARTIDYADKQLKSGNL